MTVGWFAIGVAVACFSFAGGFIFHTLKWPLSEEACAAEAAVWRKRAQAAEAKLSKVNEVSNG